MNHNKIPTFKDLGITAPSFEEICKQLELHDTVSLTALNLHLTGIADAEPTMSQYSDFVWASAHVNGSKLGPSMKSWNIEDWRNKALEIFKVVQARTMDYLTIMPPAPVTEEEKAMYSRMIDLVREMPITIHAMKSNREYAEDVAFRNPIRNDTLLPVVFGLDTGPGADFQNFWSSDYGRAHFFGDWISMPFPTTPMPDPYEGTGLSAELVSRLIKERKAAKAEIIRSNQPMQAVRYSTGITSSLFYNPPQRPDHVFDEILFPTEPTPESQLFEAIQTQLRKLATGRSVEYFAEQINNNPEMQAAFTEAVYKEMHAEPETKKTAKEWANGFVTINGVKFLVDPTIVIKHNSEN
jgi:hypothetical protein